MAGYGHGYTYRGYSTYNNGMGPRADDWSKTSYASDHVCRPVIIDAEGRKHPIVSYSSNQNVDSYVTKTEAIVEHVHSPLVTEYKHTSTTMVEPYGFVQDQWRRPSSPVKNYGGVQDQWRRPSSPVKDYGAVQDHWRQPSSPVKDYGPVQDQWRRPSSPVHDRPQEVENFITKVQTDASRPNRFGPLNATHWRRTPNSTGYHNNNGGDYSDMSNNEWNKPSSNTIRNGSYDDYKSKNDSVMEPTVVTNGGWARPSRSTWSAPPNASLSSPTTDIGVAMETLKEAAKPSAGNTASQYSVPITSGPKSDGYSETIDSREAARRYGNFNSSSRPVNNYSTTIDSGQPTLDSREAMKKYGGRAV